MPDDLMNAVDNLVIGTQREADQKRRTALAEYGEIVRRSDRPQRDDPKRIVALLDLLGRTMEDFKADLAAWRQHVQLRSQIPSDAELKKMTDASNAAHKAHEEYQRQSKAERERLYNAFTALHDTRAGVMHLADSAQRGMVAIERQHPHLFARE